MKRFVFIICIILSFRAISQPYTFSGTTAHDNSETGTDITSALYPSVIVDQNGWDAYQKAYIEIPVSGLSTLTTGTLELIQVNLNYGDGSTSISTSTDVFIKSPNGDGNYHKLLDGGSVTYKQVNTKLRDHSQLNLPCKVSIEAPYNAGYYQTSTADMFNQFNGENPNGTWWIYFTNGSGFSRPKITSVELVFGSLTEIDITGNTDNDACSTPQPFCNEAEIIYHNVGRTGDNSSDPPVSSANPCAWNNNNDNTSWFSFEATQSSAVISISGLDGSSHQQYIIVGNYTGGNSCSQSDIYTVTGGCPTDASTIATSYSNGTYYNIEFHTSGLNVGETYYLVTDGDAGATSTAYLSVEGCSACNAVLPVELIFFKGKPTKKGNLLVWQTASEINNDFFTIERSKDGINWENIGRVKGSGNSNTIHEYSFTDDTYSTKDNYYRFKQTDYDGKYSYSKIIFLSNNIKLNNINIYPTLASNYIIVESEELTKQLNNIEILDITGNIVININANKINQSIDISNLQKGMYFVKVGSLIQKFVKK